METELEKLLRAVKEMMTARLIQDREAALARYEADQANEAQKAQGETIYH